MMLRLILFCFTSFFKYIILIIGSPVFAYLSEKTEAIIEGKEHRFNWKDIRRIVTEISNWFMHRLAIHLFNFIDLIVTDTVIGWITR